MIDGASKQAIRQAVLAARRALSDADRTTRSDAIARRLVALEAFQRARSIALYAAMGAEVATDPIDRAAVASGKRVSFPRMSEDERRLTFAVCSMGELVAGARGTREPPASAPRVEPTSIDLILVPGVAFDLQCRRLGRGRGHYDATLTSLPAGAVRIGLAFDLQLVDEVPYEAHDALLDAVVTESRVVFRLPPGVGTGRSFA